MEIDRGARIAYSTNGSYRTTCLARRGCAVVIVSTVRSKWTDEFRVVANRAPLRSVSFLRQSENREAVLTALRIRAVESALYDAFGDELVGDVAAERRVSRKVIFALGLSAIVNILLAAAVLRTYYF